MERLYRKAQRGSATDILADLKPEIPFPLSTSAQGGSRTVAMNAAAQKAGVKKDQLLTNAKTLCPTLKVFEHNPKDDQEELDKLTLWTIRYSPWVTADPPDGIMIDISGCAHLLGGEEALINDIYNRFSRFGFKAQISIADTIGAAWAMSHFGDNRLKIIKHGETKTALKSLPISALKIDQKTTERLMKVGLKTIGSLSDKPRAPLAARYGESLTSRLDQIMGKKPESLSPIVEPPDYRTHKKFAEPVLMLEQIECSFHELATSMANILEEAGLGARQFVLFLHRVDGDVKYLEVRTSTLTCDADHMTRLMEEKLSNLSEDYDTGFGIEQIILGAYHTETINHQQISLNGKKESGSEAEFRALIDRYGNRLGFDNVGKFLPLESYIPERSERLVSVSEKIEKSKNWQTFLSDLQGGNHLGRPILLLPRPEPITAIAEVPDGPPVHFEWRRLKYRIIRAEGPERLAPEWWQEAREACEPTRDYFRVEDTDGGRFWLFRQGLYERKETPTWFMHGFFA